MEDYTWSNQGKSLQRELLHLPPSLTEKGIVMVGSSMSVGSALHAIVQESDPAPNDPISLISCLVLTIPPTSWEVRDPTRTAMNIWANKVENEGVEAFWEYLCSFPPVPFMANAKPDYREIVGPFIKNISPKALAGLFRASAISDLPERSTLSKISIPTLIMCRTGDPLHPISMGEELKTLIPNSELVIAESGADVEKWPELIREFIDKRYRLSPLQ